MVSNCTAPAPARPKGKYHGPGRAPDHVPRPPNAFILFRSHFFETKVISRHLELHNRCIPASPPRCGGAYPPRRKGPGMTGIGK
ncbi:hypothetical protein JB92DRAFT_3010089 [Gautieria morchelliformis]|nr:hypothetical protein JB92DRAFT_3010089 [Gautieria morchelliformis]